MKQLKKLMWCFLVAIALLTSCQREDSYSDKNPLENPAVSEAREFFEATVTDASTRGILNQEKGWNPGDVTPRWEDAAVKQYEDYQYVFVPIHTQNRYIARETAIRDSIERRYHVAVSQVLCIRKNEHGEKGAVYLTLIPSKGYFSTNKNNVVDKYIRNEGFHGNLTGRVLYNDIVTFSLLAVDKVVDGKYEWGFSRWTAPSNHSFWRNYRKMFKNIQVFGVTGTRGFIIDGGEIDPAETIYCTTCKPIGRTGT